MHTLIMPESDFLVRKIQYLGISIKGRPKLTAQGENKVTTNNTIDELKDYNLRQATSRI
jgi:hypothetical protein